MITGVNNTWIPINWSSRRQGATAVNTADAELTAKSESVHQYGLPLTGMMESVTGRMIRLISYGDNDASLLAIRKGYSRRLAYLKKTQRVSIGSMHEIFYREDNAELIQDDFFSVNRLMRVSTDLNIGDLFTKPLTSERHWFLIGLFGKVSV